MLANFVAFNIVLGKVFNVTLKTSKCIRSINYWIVQFIWAKFVINLSSYQVFRNSMIIIGAVLIVSCGFSIFLLNFCCIIYYLVSSSFFSFRRVGNGDVFCLIFISSFFSFILPSSSWPSTATLSRGTISSLSWTQNMRGNVDGTRSMS